MRTRSRGAAATSPVCTSRRSGTQDFYVHEMRRVKGVGIAGNATLDASSEIGLEEKFGQC